VRKAADGRESPANATRRSDSALARRTARLEALTHTERLQSTYAERFRAIQQLYAFWKLLGKFPDPDTRPLCDRWIEAKRRWIEKHMPSKVNF
jgi:hypothetical protein